MSLGETVPIAEVNNGRGEMVDVASLSHLAIGTMQTRNLQAACKLYESFLGFEVAAAGEGRVLLRDRRAKYLMEHGERDFFVIEVTEVADIAHPQKMLNHWGFTVSSEAEVQRIHAFAKAHAEEFWIDKVRPITNIHNAYGFYFIDKDSNWWEIEYRAGKSNEDYFRIGSFDEPVPGSGIGEAIAIAPTAAVGVGSDAYLTHGTHNVGDIKDTQDLYTSVLGLRVVRHVPIAQFVSGGGDFALVGVQVGNQVVKQGLESRWIILVDSGEIRERHRHAHEHAERCRYQVSPIERDADGYPAFHIGTSDGNWFELTERPFRALSQPFEEKLS